MNDEQKLFWDNRPPAAMQALHDVMAERHRQMMVEGWTAKHDDEHAGGSMARAAAAYALAGSSDGRVVGDELTPSITERVWSSTGWAWKWWKPKDKRRNLIRAAALVLAEIERLDRAEARRWKPCARCTTPDYCTNQLRGCDIAESREAGIAPLDSAAGVPPTTQAKPQGLYVECCQCDDCQHIGINDAPGEKAACNSCDWTGHAPQEDRCPGCGDVGTMTRACPECGGRYRCVAEGHIDAKGEPVTAGVTAAPYQVVAPSDAGGGKDTP